MAVPYLACMTLVAQIYHLPPRVLPSIQAVEGGSPGLAHPNTNATEDLGVMQVNTTWLTPLARYTHTTVATVYTRLRNEACYNVAAAGAIMRTYLDETHGDLMRAVGNYHSHTPVYNAAYQSLVMQSAQRLFVPGAARPMAAPGAAPGAPPGAPPVVAVRTVAERLALQRRLLRGSRHLRG